MITKIKHYTGPQENEELYSLINLGDYILPKNSFTPSDKYNKKLGTTVSKIIITYPLSQNAEINISGVETLNDLLKDVVESYQKIYQMENESSPKKAMIMCEEFPECSLINRNRTDGMFGIWGHTIEDLAIHTIYIYKDGSIKVGVDS